MLTPLLAMTHSTNWAQISGPRFEGVEGLGQLSDQICAERVQRLGPIERDDTDLILGIDDDVFVSHGKSPNLWRGAD